MAMEGGKGGHADFWRSADSWTEERKRAGKKNSKRDVYNGRDEKLAASHTAPDGRQEHATRT
jgi:hypothetical protein